MFVLEDAEITAADIATSPCAQFDASSTENQNGEHETGNT